MLRNIASWRVKETDRIAAMATELRKLGAAVEEGPDWLRIAPPAASSPPPPAPARVASIPTTTTAWRCASRSPPSAPRPVTINDPGCVAKTFPTYFDVLRAPSSS